MSFARQALGLVIATTFASACGQPSEPTSPSEAANQRLEGDWRLVSFRPTLALEAPLQGLLDAQYKTLTISFGKGEFTATGPGVQTSGRYEITSASGDVLTGRILDSSGVAYGITGQFVAAQVHFTSTNSPWVGTGVLERAQP
jgi:hypothetical protein